MTQLPNKNDPFGFRNLVFDRQRSFMVMEIVRVREALMGSDALIAKVKDDMGACMLSEVITKSTENLSDAFDQFFNTISELGWGDSALRWLGFLPAVASFAPNAPSRACFSKSCVCDGKLKQKDIIAIVKSQHKPEWQRFLDYMEARRAEGHLPNESASELRVRLQRSLDKLNTDYLKLIDIQLGLRAFPHGDLVILDNERELWQDFKNVTPPSTSTVQALSPGDPFALSIEALHQLRAEGKIMRETVIHVHRMVATRIYYEADRFGGRHAEELHAEAEKRWIMTMDLVYGMAKQNSAFHLAALALEQTKPERAIEVAQLLRALTYHVDRDCASYSSLRWMFVTALSTGTLPMAPAADMQLLSQELKDIVRNRRGDAWVFEGKAHLVMGTTALRETGTSGAMSKQSIAKILTHLAKANECYQNAMDLQAVLSLPLGDLPMFQARCKNRFDTHLKATQATQAHQV